MYYFMKKKFEKKGFNFIYIINNINFLLFIIIIFINLLIIVIVYSIKLN